MTTTYRIYLIVNAPKKKKVFILNKHLESTAKWPRFPMKCMKSGAGQVR